VFGAEMNEHSWDHALGGMHVLIWESDQLVGHAAVVQRRLLHRDRARRAGYVEGVVVRADRRGHGYGGALMEAAETIIRGAYELGALGATELGAGFYAARGWKAWRGQTWALSPAGRVRAKAEYGGLYVLEVAVPLELTGELTCDWREGHLW
jgi:aminoglycoside 2'-N-acetyltransferase I